jgi:hypothetical protein
MADDESAPGQEASSPRDWKGTTVPKAIFNALRSAHRGQTKFGASHSAILKLCTDEAILTTSTNYTLDPANHVRTKITCKTDSDVFIEGQYLGLNVSKIIPKIMASKKVPDEVSFGCLHGLNC